MKNKDKRGGSGNILSPRFSIDQSLKFSNTPPKWELLAPAGSPETFRAVIAAGADAVYVGGSSFGARAYAENFSQEELLEAIDYAHLWGRRVYLTVNTLMKEDELEQQLYSYLLPFYRQGIDAVLVQDFGALSYIHRYFPDLPIHSSTQMTITASEGVRFLKQYGVTRAVMARELSLEEMKRIRQETGMELEAFVHGALCYSYSGQCLFSSLLGGRSGNRGRCAQPCRLPYSVMDGDGKELCARSSVLSLKDLRGIEDLQALRDAGVYSLKIEGRMKQADYAAGVVSVYRKYMDQILEQETAPASARTSQEPDSDNARTSDGYGIRSDFVRDKHASVEEIWGNGSASSSGRHKPVIIRGEDLQILSDLGSRGTTDLYYHTHNSRKMVTFDQSGYKKDNEALSRAVRAAFVDTVPKLHLTGRAEFVSGKPAFFQVELLSADGIVYSGRANGDRVEPARKAPVAEADIAKRLRKTGDTPFIIEALELKADDGIFCPNGALNQLRRQALEELRRNMLKEYRRNEPAEVPGRAGENREVPERAKEDRKVPERTGEDWEVPERTEANRESSESVQADRKSSEETMAEPGAPDDPSASVIVTVADLNQLRIVAKMLPALKQRAQELFGPAGMLRIQVESFMFVKEEPSEAAFKLLGAIKDSGAELILAIPHIFRGQARQLCIGKKASRPDEPLRLFDGVLVRNYEELFAAKELFPGRRLYGDHHLYSYNNAARNAFFEAGLCMDTVPLELNYREIQKRDNRSGAMVIYGYYPLMLSAGCVRKNTIGCGVGEGILYLKDRFNKCFPVKNICSHCYNVIYNSLPTCLFDRTEEIMAAGIRNLRMDFTVESPAEAGMVLEAFCANEKELSTAATRGHYQRGVE